MGQSVLLQEFHVFCICRWCGMVGGATRSESYSGGDHKKRKTPECFSVSSSLCLHMWGKDMWGQGQNTGIWGLLILRGWLANELQEYQSVSTARAGVLEVLAACTSENLIELTIDRALGAWYPDKSRHSTKYRMIINISLWLWYFPEPIEQKILVKELSKL